MTVGRARTVLPATALAHYPVPVDDDSPSMRGLHNAFDGPRLADARSVCVLERRTFLPHWAGKRGPGFHKTSPDPMGCGGLLQDGALHFLLEH